MRVLIASDGSERILETGEAVRRLTGDARSEVFVLHVLHPEEGDEGDEEQLALADRRAAALRGWLAETGLQAEVLVETRPLGRRVYEHVLGRARQLEVDAVVVASRRAGGLIDTLFGGVAQEILRHSPIPVIVVRPHGKSPPPPA